MRVLDGTQVSNSVTRRAVQLLIILLISIYGCSSQQETAITMKSSGYDNPDAINQYVINMLSNIDNGKDNVIIDTSLLFNMISVASNSTANSGRTIENELLNATLLKAKHGIQGVSIWIPENQKSSVNQLPYSVNCELQTYYPDSGEIMKALEKQWIKTIAPDNELSDFPVYDDNKSIIWGIAQLSGQLNRKYCFRLWNPTDIYGEGTDRWGYDRSDNLYFKPSEQIERNVVFMIAYNQSYCQMGSLSCMTEFFNDGRALTYLLPEEGVSIKEALDSLDLSKLTEEAFTEPVFTDPGFSDKVVFPVFNMKTFVSADLLNEKGNTDLNSKYKFYLSGQAEFNQYGFSGVNEDSKVEIRDGSRMFLNLKRIEYDNSVRLCDASADCNKNQLMICNRPFIMMVFNTNTELIEDLILVRDITEEMQDESLYPIE